MKTQIMKMSTKIKPIEYFVGQNIEFSYETSLQNIGTTREYTRGAIQKVNRVTVNVLDDKGNLWKVNKEDILK